MDVDPGGSDAPGSTGEHTAPPRWQPSTGVPIPTTPVVPKRLLRVRPSPLGPLDVVESFVQTTPHELVDAFIKRMFDYFDEDNDRLLNYTEFACAIRSLEVRNSHWTTYEVYVEACCTHFDHPLHGMTCSTFMHILWTDNASLGFMTRAIAASFGRELLRVLFMTLIEHGRLSTALWGS